MRFQWRNQCRWGRIGGGVPVFFCAVHETGPFFYERPKVCGETLVVVDGWDGQCPSVWECEVGNYRCTDKDDAHIDHIRRNGADKVVASWSWREETGQAPDALDTLRRKCPGEHGGDLLCINGVIECGFCRFDEHYAGGHCPLCKGSQRLKHYLCRGRGWLPKPDAWELWRGLIAGGFWLKWEVPLKGDKHHLTIYRVTPAERVCEVECDDPEEALILGASLIGRGSNGKE